MKNKLVLLGSYGNGDWEPLAFLREDESDQCEKLLKEFQQTFGKSWSFKWGKR
jgi:hypothetical protein